MARPPPGAAVLTYRFWTTVLKSDPSVLGKDVRLGHAPATIVGVLEPLGALSGGNRNHRQRRHQPASSLGHDGDRPGAPHDGAVRAPGARAPTLEAGARRIAHGARRAWCKAHPEAYSPKADFRIDAVLLRDQITSRARTVLLVLLAASVLVFVIACSNVANLILARTVRRENELAIRAALGASTRRAAPDAAGGKPAAVRRRRGCWAC